MNSPGTRKIVSINAIGRDRSPGLRIIEDCSEQFAEALCSWLGTIKETIGEEFFELADGTRDRKLQTRYLDLRRNVERDWTQFIGAFRDAFSESRDSHGTPAETLAAPDFDGLQLVDDAALSEHIVLREFSAQLAETCDDELYLLDRRIAALLGQEEPAAERNPLAPGRVCRTLGQASCALGLAAEDRLLLLRRIERHLHTALPERYRIVNSYLSDRGILPDLRRCYQQRRREPSAGAGGATATAVLSHAAEALPDGAGDILGLLQRLAGKRSAADGEGATPRAGGISPASISHTFLASLNEAQHTPWQANQAPATNQVGAIRDSAIARQVGPLESVTIDIVAMLFDFIFNDDELPDSVKLLVGKLQIPVLKVAMLDQSFFANRQHPARRFLDGITGIALHWGQGAGEDDPFQHRLAEVVERIQLGFETNIEIFNDGIRDLEAFVNAREAQEEATLNVAAEATVRRETEESASERARAALLPIIEKTSSALVGSFLAEHWSVVLRQQGIAHADDSAAWRDSVEVAEQLAWSVAAKTDAGERLLLIDRLPPLLARINAGLAGTGISDEARRTFFDALVELHAAALKGTPGDSGPPTATPEAAIKGEGDLLVTRRVEDGVTIEDVMLVGAAPMRRTRDREALEQVRRLRRGDWVDFVDAGGGTARERLNWISPHKGILVFSNHRAAKAISISPEALARRVRDGSARIVEEKGSVFAKAIDGVMHSLGAA